MARDTKRYEGTEGKGVWQELQHVISMGYDNGRVFSDFLEVALNSILSLTDNMGRPDLVEKVLRSGLDGVFNERYMATVGRYRENGTRPKGGRPADYFARAWGLLQAETAEKGEDVLGAIYTERVTRGEHGQFFTPNHITDMMAAMVAGDEKPETEAIETKPDLRRQTIHDPCCGSGRFLISAAKRCPNALLTGVDKDLRCARMTALNLWLFDLDGVAYCGDSLAQSWSVAYEIRRGGYIWERKPEEKWNYEILPIDAARLEAERMLATIRNVQELTAPGVPTSGREEEVLRSEEIDADDEERVPEPEPPREIGTRKDEGGLEKQMEFGI